MLDLAWWVGLLTISVTNIILCIRYYFTSCCSTSRHLIITILCTVYVAACFVRATFPVRIIERTCFNSKIISPFTDRVIATVGEMSFIILIAVVSHFIVLNTSNSTWQKYLIGITVILIAIAQTCCWAGCITKNQLFNASEESLWAITAIILIIIWSGVLHYTKRNQTPINKFVQKGMYVCIGITSLYTAYMITQDVPMYINRWKTLEKNFNSFSKGIEEMKVCQYQTTSETVWKDDSLWRIGYFSGGVWCSMALVLWLHKYEKMIKK